MPSETPQPILIPSVVPDADVRPRLVAMLVDLAPGHITLQSFNYLVGRVETIVMETREIKP